MKYFLHDSSAFSDEKITELYINFGYEGLGLFYTILEKLSFQEKPVKTEVLKKQLFVGKKLEKCWKFMEEIDLISSNNGETFNKQLLNFSEKFTIKKEKNKKRISEWRKNQEVRDNVTRNESVRNAHKDNISKDNISKDKDKRVIEKSENKPHLFSDSKFFVFEEFEKQFEGTDYEVADLRFYYENVKNWSAGGGNKKLDWIATARNFMLKDRQENKLILKNGNKQQTSSGKSKAQEQFERITEQLRREQQDKFGNNNSGAV